MMIRKLLEKFRTSKKANQNNDTIQVNRLEPRVMYSAVPGAELLADAMASAENAESGDQVSLQEQLDDLATSSDSSFGPEESARSPEEQLDQLLLAFDEPTESVTELILIDRNVEGYEELVADLEQQSDSNFEIIFIESNENGVEQVTAALANYSGLEAVHFVTHGSDGLIQLGNSSLSAGNLGGYAGEIAGWQSALGSDADILFYGCNLAESEYGQDFLNEIAALTDADVAASDDLTGSSELGGDWELEYEIGHIEADIVFSAAVADWNYVLDTIEISTTKDTYIDIDQAGLNYGDSTSLIVDQSGGGYGDTRTLLDFDLSSLGAGATIHSVTLSMNATANTGNFDVNVYELTESWDEGAQSGASDAASWDDRLDGTSWSTAGGTFNTSVVATSNTSSIGEHTWDITSLVQDWYSGAKTNHGIILANDDSGTDSVTYDSSEGASAPKIIINYTPGQDIHLTESENGGLDINNDGGNDLYLIADDGDAILGGATDLTLEVNFASTRPPSDSSHDVDLLSFATSKDANDVRFNIEYDSPGVYELNLHIDGIRQEAVGFNAASLFDGQPHTVSVTWSSAAGAYEFFVDGVSVDSGTGHQTSHVIGTGGEFVIGREQDSIGGGFDDDQFFAGTLYDVRVFDDVRTSGEILANHDSEISREEDNLVANWQFGNLFVDESTGALRVTETVGGNNLTLGRVSSGGSFTESVASLSLSVDENESNGTIVGQVTGTDVERTALINTLLTNDPDLVYNAETGKFYKAVTTASTWTDASSSALASNLNGVGGQLATIRNGAENAAVTQFAIDAGQEMWVGASDATVEGEWRWFEDGSAAEQFWSGDFTGSAVDGAYTDWQAGRPDNGDGGTQDYLSIRPTGEWNDEDNADPSTGYIIEWDADDVLDNAGPVDEQPIVYSITSQTETGAFAINSDNGEITVADGTLLDYESDPTHSVTIRMTDIDGNYREETITINLVDQNDAPSVGTNTGLTLNEGATATITTAMLEEGDHDDSGAEVTYTLTADVANGTLKLNGSTLGVNDTFTQADIDANLLTYEHDGTETTSDSFDFSLADGGEGGVSPATGTFSITVSGVNEQPAFANLDGTPTFVEDGSPVVLDSNVTVSDAELTAINDFNGSTLTLARSTGANAEDVYSETGLLGSLGEGGSLTYNGTTIGTVTTNSGGQLVLTFNGNATNSLVNSAMQAIAYSNSSNEPVGPVQIDWTFNDKNSGTQGSGGELTATGSTTVTLTASNDDPYNSGSMPTDLAATEDTLSNVHLGSINLEDADHGGGNLTLKLNTSTGGNLFATTGGGVTVAGSGTSSLTLTGSLADLNTFIDNVLNIQYQHSVANTNGNDADQIEVLINDNGNTGLGGGSDISLGTANVDISAVNDQPVFSNLDATPTFVEDGSPVVLDADVTISDAELTALDDFDGASLTLVRNGGANAEDVFSATGLLGALGEGGSLIYNATTIGTVTTNSGGTLVLTFNSNATNSLVNSAMQTIAYSNSSDEPSGPVQIDWSFEDNNSGSQGSGGSQTAMGSTTVSLTASNDDPYNNGLLPTDIPVTEDTLSNIDLSQIDIVDPDHGGSNLTLKLTTSTGGNLFATTGGGVSVSGSGTGTMTLTGSQDDLNTFLNTSSNIQYQHSVAHTNGNDADQIAIAINDNGNTGLGGGSDIALGTVNIDISAVNDQPVFSNLNATPTFVEDGSPVVLDADVTLSDAELSSLDNFNGSTLTLVRNGSANAEDLFSATGLLGSLGGGGSLTYNGTNIGTVTTNSGGTLVLTFNSNATNSLVNSTMQAIAYSNSSDEPVGPVQIDWTFEDNNGGAQGSGGSQSVTGNTTVSLTASNDDPYNSGVLPTDMPATEDTLSNVDLSAINLEDPDHGGGNLTVKLDTSTGGELFATSGGGVTVSGSGTGSVTLTGSLANLNTYLNSASNVQYQHGTTHTNGNDADQISVAINDNGNTGLGGGTDIALGTVNVDISAVNDQPVFSNLDATPTFVEDGSPVVLDADVSIADAELTALNNFNGATLTLVRNGSANSEDVFSATGLLGSLSEGGGLTYNGTTIGTVTTNSGGTLELTFDSNATNSLVNSVMQAIAYSNSSDEPSGPVQIDWAFEDNNSGTQGSGGSLTATGSTTVTLTASNDDPYNNGLLPSDIPVTEDTLSNIDLSQIDIVDPDHGGGSLTLKLTTSTGGDLFATTGGGVTVSGSGTGTMTLTGSQADLNTFLNVTSNIQYQHSVAHTNGNDADQISIAINDNGNTGLGGGTDIALGTVNIDISAVNDQPVFSNLDATPTFVEDGSPVVLDADVTISDTELTALDNFNGSTLTLVRNGGASAEDVFSATGLLGALGEGGSLTYNGTTIGTVTTNSSGTLVLTFNGNATNSLVNSAMQAIAYSNSSDEPVGPVQIDWSFDDENSGTQGSGGALAATGSTTVTLSAANDDPYNAGSLPTDISVTEDQSSNVDLSLIDIVDPDHGGGNLTIKLTTASGGNLSATTGGGVTVAGSGTSNLTLTGSQADLNTFLNVTSNVQYLNGTANTNGDNADQIAVVINDNGNTGVGGGSDITLGTVNVDISAVNDAPVVTTPGSAYNATENAPLNIHGTGFSVADVDEADLGATATLAVGEGGLTISVGDSGVTIDSGNGTSSVVLSGTIQQINDLLTGSSTGTIVYQNDVDAPATSTNITLTVNDQGNVGSDPGTSGDATSEEDTGSQTINIAAVNDDPVNTVPVSATVTEEVATAITGISVRDIDDTGTLTTRLQTTNGILNVTLSGSATISSGANGSKDLTILGSEADINATLASLTYTGDTNVSGVNSDTLVVTTDDQGNHGSGGALTDTDNVQIDITGTADEPVTGNTTVTMNEDGAYAIQSADIPYADSDGDPIDHIQITALPTNGQLQLSGANVSLGDTISIADINAGNLVYTPSADGNGTAFDDFGFRVSDGSLYSNETATTTVLNSSFNFNSEGFSYGDDAFGTSAPANASGTYDNNDGFGGTGGLLVSVGGNAGGAASSGGWSQSFNLVEDGVVSVSVRYRLDVANQLDTGEFGEAILEIDGVRFGSDLNGSLAHIEGGGDSGWQQATFEIELSAGSHNLVLGAFANSTNANNESVDVFFDDVLIESKSFNTFEFDVNAVNDAPVLDNTGALVLTDITEDDTSPAGNTVAQILASAGGNPVTDVDAGAIEGIAVTGVDNTNGTWEYSLNGSTWLSFSASGVSTSGTDDTSAVMLDESSFIRFVPDADYNGSGGDITFRAWDQTDGSVDGDSGVDVSSNGGTTSFSSQTETASITVLADNDAPILGTNSLTLLEGETVTITTSHLNSTDIDNPVASLTYQVSNVNNGQFELTSAPQSAITSFTHAQVVAGDVVFVHDGGETAPSYEVTVSDGSLSDGPHAAAISFTNINDAPEIQNLSGDAVVSFNDGSTTKLDSGAAATLFDADSPSDFNGGTLTVTGNSFDVLDQLRLDTSGSISLTAGFTNGSLIQVSGTTIGTLSGVSDSGVTITFNSNSNTANVETIIKGFNFGTTSTTLGSRTIDFTLVDGDGTANGGEDTSSTATVSVTVAEFGNGLVTTNEDTTYTFSATDFDFTGTTGSDLTQIVIQSLPTDGTLTLNGSALNVNDVVTKAQIDSGLLRFVPDADENGLLYADFDFSINQGNSSVSVLAGDTSSYTLGGGQLDETDELLADTDNFGLSGTYSTSISVVAANSTIDAAYLSQGQVFFNGWVSDSNLSGSELSAIDSWVSSGGILISTNDDTTHDALASHFGLTIGGTGSSTWHVENDTHAIMNGPFGLVGNVNDPFSATGSISYFDSASLAGGDVILASDSVSGEPTVVLRQHGSGYILFTSDEGIFRANMTGGGTISTANDILAANIFAWAADQVPASETHTMDITVNAVNDDPTNVGVLPSDIPAVEDVLSNVDLSGIDLFDIDSATGDLTMTLTTGNGGTLSASPSGGVVIGGSGTGVLTLTGTQAELNTYLNTASNIQFLSGLHANGNDQDTIQVDVTDNGNVGLGGGGTINFGTVNVDISAVNDEATFSNLDATPTFVEDGTAVVLDSDVTIFDQELSTWDDFNGATLTLVRNGGANAEDVFSASGLLGPLTEAGALTFNGTTIGTVTTNSSGTLVLTFNSNATNSLVNSAMQAIAYSNSNDEPGGPIQIDWTFDDENSGLQGSGGPLTATGSTTVSLVASNDDPYNNGSLPTDVTVIEDVVSNVDLSSMEIVDPDHGGGNMTVKLNTSTGGNLFATSGGGVVVSGSGTGALTLTGSVSSLNTFLDSASNVQYQHSTSNTNGNDADQIAVVVNDNGNTGLGGGTDIALGSVNVDISAVNDQPVFSNLNGTPTFVEDGSPVVLDADVTISDVELSSLNDFNGSTLTLVRNGGANAEDLFSASGLLGTLGEGGALTYNGTTIGTVTTNSGGTLVLTFNGNATNTLVNSTMQAIAYSNTNDEPGGPVQIDWTFDDQNSGAQGSGGALSATGSTTVTLTASNDDPYNNGSLPTDVTVTEDVASNVDLSAIDIVDPDHGGGNLTLKLTTSTGGNLTATSGSGVTVVGSGTGVMTLTGTQTDLNNYLNNVSNVQYQHGVTHTNGDDADQITIAINDNGNTGLGGGTDIALGTVNVDILEVNDDPFNVGGSLPASISVVEDTAQNLDLSTLEINDVDVSTDNMTVTIASTSGATFTSLSGGGVTVTGSGTTSLQLTGSLADINTFIDTVSNIQITGASDAYGTNADQVNVLVSDNGNNGLGGGGNILMGTMSVNISAVNDAAVATNLEPSTLTYIENSGPATITNLIQLSDVDDTMLESATIQISGNYNSSQDVLAFVDTLNIFGAWDSVSGTLTLTGTDTIANYEAALRSITYENTSDNPTDLDRTVRFVVNDGDNDSIPVTRDIDIVPTNDPSVLAGIEGTDLSYVENAGAVSVTSALSISDIDDTFIESAQIQISGNYVNGEDVLAFANTLNISGSWNSATGVLTLTGTDTLANYEAALRSVTYENTSNDPSTLTRTVDFVVNDGDNDSNSISRDVLVGAVNDPPVATGIETSSLSYTENDVATVVTNTISLSDVDDINLESATIQITGNYVNGEDVLAFVDTVNITGVFDSATGTLTLTGTDSIANYEMALRSVTYFNTSHDPSALPRTVEFVVNDGALDSNAQTRNIDVIPENDAPMAYDDGPIVGNEASPFNLSPTLNDGDYEGDTLKITQVNGLSLTPGGSAVAVTGGTIQLQPDGVTLTFTPTPNFFGNADFTYTITDGNGLYDTANLQLDIVDTSAPDMPVVTILEDVDDNGYINLAEQIGSVEYSVALPVGARVGETLDINGVQTVLTAGDIAAGFVTGSLPAPSHNDTVSISVFLFDPAGNSSAVHTDVAVVDLVAPNLAGPLDLVDWSDTGFSNTDNYTGDMNPDFCLPAGSGTPGDTVTIYSDGVAVGTGIVNADGSAIVSTTISGFTVQKLTYTFTDPAGNESPQSLGLFVEFYDNTLPYQPPSDPSRLGVEQVGGGGSTVINLLAPQLNEDDDEDDDKVAFFRTVLRSNTFEVSNEFIRRQSSDSGVGITDVAIESRVSYEKEIESIRFTSFVGDLDYRMASTRFDNLESNDMQMMTFLDQLSDFTDEFRDEFSDISLLAGTAKAGAGVVIAGYAFWIARAAFIASWFATSIPAFSRFDPLMILDAKKSDSETLAQIAKGKSE